MLLGDRGRLQNDLRRCGREGGEDSACVEPPGAVMAEYPLPVDVALLQLRSCRMGPVRTTHGRPNAKPAFGEIQADPGRFPNAVVLRPLHVLHTHAALVNQVFQKPSHGAVGNGGDDGSFFPKTPLQPASNIIFPAAFPHAEISGGVDSLVAWIQPDHDFTQGNDVVLALILWPER